MYILLNNVGYARKGSGAVPDLGNHSSDASAPWRPSLSHLSPQPTSRKPSSCQKLTGHHQFGQKQNRVVLELEGISEVIQTGGFQIPSSHTLTPPPEVLTDVAAQVIDVHNWSETTEILPLTVDNMRPCVLFHFNITSVRATKLTAWRWFEPHQQTQIEDKEMEI